MECAADGFRKNDSCDCRNLFLSVGDEPDQ